MKIIHTIAGLRAGRKTAGSVAFVPTMGNLHAGHLALVAQARAAAEHVVVSVFVNRLQFGQGEDFDQYPRTLEDDAAKLRDAGVSVLFAPSEQELYPRVRQDYQVEPPHLQNELCGQFRPNHFRGVATVVCKLFNIVQPDAACFGKKDYQQLAIIQGMTDDLNIPVRIIPVDTGRAEDGLALSSRNQYLSAEERREGGLCRNPYARQPAHRPFGRHAVSGFGCGTSGQNTLNRQFGICRRIGHILNKSEFCYTETLFFQQI